MIIIFPMNMMNKTLEFDNAAFTKVYQSAYNNNA